MSTPDLPSPPTEAPRSDSLATAFPQLGDVPPPANLPAPPGYDLLHEIGRGGMGVVYLARQAQLNRVVALKMILAGKHASGEEQRRFLSEAETVAAVKHPGIVEVYDLGLHGELPFFALEHCAGGSLADRIDRSPLVPRDAAALVEALGRATQAAHDAGVVHRDLKPANVLLTKDGVIKIADFGLAKRDSGPGLTRTGEVMGTPSYMSPEQALGKKDVGRPTDVYALGAILYECLTGRPPFLAATTIETLQAVVADEPPPPRALNPKVPRDLETIALKCLQKAPEKRYASATALADDLRRWLDGVPILARPAGVIERVVKWARRRPAAAALLGVSIAAAAALVALTLWALDQRQAAVAALGRERQALRDKEDEENARLAQQRKAREAQVASLLDVAPQAVPAILEALAPYRDEVRPLLQAARARPAPPGATAEALALWRQHRARAALALLAEDETQVGLLAERLMEDGLAPDEMLLVRDALRPHGGKLKEEMWKRAEGRGEGRFRALVALAAFDATSPRWEARAAVAADGMLAANPLHVGRWVEGLRPVRGVLLPRLGRVFRGEEKALAEHRKAAANVLADYLSADADALAERLMEANEEQFPTLFDVLQRRHRGRAVVRLTGAARLVPSGGTEAAREALALRQANAGLALLKLGRDEEAWRLMRHSPYPEARTRLVAMLAPGGVEAARVVARLESERDVSARRALILALGEYGEEQLPAAVRGPVVKKLLGWYREDPDSGVHGAIDWLLRHGKEGPENRKLDWGQRAALERIDAELTAEAQRRLRQQAASRAAVLLGGGPLARAAAVMWRPAGEAGGWHVNAQGMTFAVVEGSKPFQMGSPKGEAGRRDDDEEQHWRRIGRRFAMGTRPVTVAEWAKFQKAVSQIPRFNIKQWAPTADCPIVGVSWYDAAAYCRWLSEQEGVPEHEMVYPPVRAILEAQASGKPLRLLPGHLSRTGYRLPSEAEWEMACRAEAATSRYYGSSLSLLGRHALFLTNARDRSWPTGQKRPNDLGLFDMQGNVWTWVNDRFNNYPEGTIARPVPDEGEIADITDRQSRVLRGGSFSIRAPNVRSSVRNDDRPSYRDNSIGVRLCRTYHLASFTTLPSTTRDERLSRASHPEGTGQ